MSHTLFWYIFRDLVRIFVLATAALAGILSFGGLFKPLTEHGLNSAQVGQILAYFMPAMTAYSLPIAALFATAMVYGRLSADNELTACRAAGISHLWLAAPAAVLGLLVAIVSLLLLSFIVPVFTLKVEQVIYSNLARMVAHQIDRNNQVRLDELTIYAQEAHLPESNSEDEQVVVLRGLMIVTYEPSDRTDINMQVPREFWMARQATAFIRQDNPTEEATLDVVLEGGTKFPRRFTGAMQGGVETVQFGPVPLPSPIRERTKFMDIRRLQELYRDPGSSVTIQSLLRDFIQKEQQREYLEMLAWQFNTQGRIVFDSSPDAFVLTRGEALAELRGDELVIPMHLPEQRSIAFRQERAGRLTLQADAAELRLRTRADNTGRLMVVSVELHDVIVRTPEAETLRTNFPRTFSAPMPQQVRQLHEQRTPADYVAGARIISHEQRRLMRELIRLRNGVQSEMHARASFAVSCLVLVLVGCALGMMFRSGDFLSAFALSFVPGLVTIALILTGQKAAENIPWTLENFRDPLPFSLVMVWGGNVAAAAIAVVLLARLQRQ